jgi:hypothetical protein
MDHTRENLGDNQCNEEDMILFHSLTKLTINDDAKANFWGSPWLNGLCPMHTAPLIHAALKKKSLNARNVLWNNSLVNLIDTSPDLTIDHINHLSNFWALLQHISHHEGVQDSISWKFTANACYSIASA